MSMDEIPVVLTVDDLRKILKISRSAAYNLARSDQLEVIKIGKSIRITRKALMDYLGV